MVVPAVSDSFPWAEIVQGIGFSCRLYGLWLYLKVGFKTSLPMNHVKLLLSSPFSVTGVALFWFCPS